MIIFLFIVLTIAMIFITDRIVDKKFYSNPFLVIGLFGLPGCGKSTLASKMAYEHFKKGWEVYTDDPSLRLSGVHYFDSEEFKKGEWLPEAMKNDKPIVLMFDEIGILYNNRDFKTNFNPDTLAWWKYHRHKRTKVIYCSQTYSDMDLKIRNLTDQYYIVKRSIFRLFIFAKLIVKKIDIQESSVSDQDSILASSGGQIVDTYEYASILKGKLCFLPKWVKKFDSFR